MKKVVERREDEEGQTVTTIGRSDGRTVTTVTTVRR
jgi:hypothetical protein